MLWTRTATASHAGSNVTVVTSATVRGSLILGAYRGAVVAAADVALAAETVSQAAHRQRWRRADRYGGWSDRDR